VGDRHSYGGKHSSRREEGDFAIPARPEADDGGTARPDGLVKILSKYLVRQESNTCGLGFNSRANSEFLAY
jgi:hypothetical protein